MCEIKTIVVSVCLILLVTAGFFIYQVYPQKKVGHQSEIEGQSPCENDYKKYSLIRGNAIIYLTKIM